MGMRLIPLKPASDAKLKEFFPDNTDMIYDDQPSEIYRIVLSASSANAPDKLITKAATADERKRGEEKAPVFEKYDIKGDRFGEGEDSIYVCKLKGDMKSEEQLFLAIQVHIFRQSDNPARSGVTPTFQHWDRTFHVENRMFSYNTSMLAY